MSLASARGPVPPPHTLAPARIAWADLARTLPTPQPLAVPMPPLPRRVPPRVAPPMARVLR